MDIRLACNNVYLSGAHFAAAAARSLPPFRALVGGAVAVGGAALLAAVAIGYRDRITETISRVYYSWSGRAQQPETETGTASEGYDFEAAVKASLASFLGPNLDLSDATEGSFTQSNVFTRSDGAPGGIACTYIAMEGVKHFLHAGDVTQGDIDNLVKKGIVSGLNRYGAGLDSTQTREEIQTAINQLSSDCKIPECATADEAYDACVTNSVQDMILKGLTFPEQNVGLNMVLDNEVPSCDFFDTALQTMASAAAETHIAAVMTSSGYSWMVGLKKSSNNGSVNEVVFFDSHGHQGQGKQAYAMTWTGDEAVQKASAFLWAKIGNHPVTLNFTPYITCS